MNKYGLKNPINHNIFGFKFLKKRFGDKILTKNLYIHQSWLFGSMVKQMSNPFLKKLEFGPSKSNQS
jgi:hypothetical protein